MIVYVVRKARNLVKNLKDMNQANQSVKFNDDVDTLTEEVVAPKEQEKQHI